MVLCSNDRVWRRREPERGVLHRVLLAHLETLLARSRRHGRGLPRFVERELYRYLQCGLLAFGFARVHCATCKRDDLVAFSCKGRGFCPSCDGRRMSAGAADLVDEVLPDVPVRVPWLQNEPLGPPILMGTWGPTWDGGTSDGRWLSLSRRDGPWGTATTGDVFWIDDRVLERFR